MASYLKLVPNDPSITTATKTIRGKSYSYITALPDRLPPLLMIFLLHGFLDLSFGWRYQILHFVSLGYGVVAIDMLGCGGSAAPDDLHDYTFRSISNDIKILARQLVGDKKIVLGGHGLGGAVVWRTALWHPDLVLGIFSISTPFFSRSTAFLTPDDPVLAFKYKPPGGPHGYLGEGVQTCGRIPVSYVIRLLVKHLVKLQQLGTLSRRESLVYSRQYLPRGEPRLEGPLRWFHFKTRSYNQEEEQELFLNASQSNVPALYISGDQDGKTAGGIVGGITTHFPNLVYHIVPGTHWCLWESAEEVNQQVAGWIANICGQYNIGHS